jgi:microsomal dipeptidase-like Zn-dependent dipeptidase
MPSIADALVVRGFSSDDITKILGGNWLRLLTQVCR